MKRLIKSIGNNEQRGNIFPLKMHIETYYRSHGNKVKLIDKIVVELA